MNIVLGDQIKLDEPYLYTVNFILCRATTKYVIYETQGGHF